MKSNFHQSVDSTRPHTLLTENVRHSGQLEYRYDDTQEVVVVPNIWYNQPFQVRVQAVRWDAKLKDEAADKLHRNPPCGMTKDAVDQLLKRYRAMSRRILAEADRMLAAGSLTHPVGAAKMQLNYGDL